MHALSLTGAGLYAGGEFTQIGGQPRSRLARVSTTSGAADAWDPRANNTVRALATPGTDVYAGGDFTSVGATTRNRLARLEPDGTLDTGWNPDASGTVNALAVSGTDVYVGGDVHDRRRGEPRPDRQAVDRRQPRRPRLEPRARAAPSRRSPSRGRPSTPAASS